jgi:hypothetical protein
MAIPSSSCSRVWRDLHRQSSLTPSPELSRALLGAPRRPLTSISELSVGVATFVPTLVQNLQNHKTTVLVRPDYFALRP